MNSQQLNPSTTDTQTLAQLRQEFEQNSNRAVSLPIAGAIVWCGVGFASLFTSTYLSTLILLFATGTIFPLGLLIAKTRQEHLTSSENPLARLMGMGVMMVNLLWALHIPLMLKAPEMVPLSVGIGLGVHWVLYSWIVNHPVGIIHATMRTGLILLVWFISPPHMLAMISLAVVVSYAVSIFLMMNRKID